MADSSFVSQQQYQMQQQQLDQSNLQEKQIAMTNKEIREVLYYQNLETLQKIYQSIHNQMQIKKKVDPILIKELHNQAVKIEEFKKIQKETQKPKYKNYLVHKNKQRQRFLNLDNLSFFFVKYILDYCNFQDLNNFSMANKKTNEIFKIHIQFRIQTEMNIVQSIEQENHEYIEMINEKRNQFYYDNDITPPNQENAFKMLTEITHKDINELKRSNKTNQNYEIYALPFILLFNVPVQTKKRDGVYKEYEYWQSLKKFMIKNDFFRMLSDVEVETLSPEKYRKLEDIVLDERFSLELAQKLSDCTYKLAKWTIGLVEIHKCMRKYSLSKLDFELLSPDEVGFCNQLDQRNLICFKILRFINGFLEKDTSQNWQNKIKDVMQKHDLSFLRKKSMIQSYKSQQESSQEQSYTNDQNQQQYQQSQQEEDDPDQLI